jgi:YcxB-like protein
MCPKKINLQMITINYILSKEDYSRFYYYELWISPGKKTAIIKKWAGKFLLFFCCLFVVKLSSPGKMFDPYFLYSILVLLTIYIFPLFVMKNTFHKQIAAYTDNPLNATFFNDCQMVISEAGIFAKGKFTTTEYQWPAIVKKEETSEYYYLYLSTQQALLIPKRAVKSETEKKQLEQLLAGCIPSFLPGK